MYDKTIIEFGFCDIRNNQGLCVLDKFIPDIIKTSSNYCLKSSERKLMNLRYPCLLIKPSFCNNFWFRNIDLEKFPQVVDFEIN